jgi:hypothetical protein
MRWHTVDYRAQRDGGDVKGALASRGFWLELPRLIPLCRLRGHKPVVDGTEGFNGRPGHRWVCCDRCGIRPEPQGILGSMWEIGDKLTLADGIPYAAVQPGGWPESPAGDVGGQLVIGGQVTTGAEVKVGNAGSEHVLAAHLCIHRVGGLYLHTERHGTWLQRRLNPTGYESKVTGVSVHSGRLWWDLWAPRDEHRRGFPRWRHGNVRLDPRDILLGERRYSYVPVGDPEPATLQVPYGGSFQVTMQLQAQALGRRHGRQRGSWTVDFECRDGIPYKPGSRGGGMTSWSVEVSDSAVQGGLWQAEAVSASVLKIAQMRARYGYREMVS